MTTGKAPLEQWRAEFGSAYRERNAPTPEAVDEASRAFKRMLADASGMESVLEVGANIGINLRGLRRAFGDRLRISAVEPNDEACALLRAADLDLENVFSCDAYEIPAEANRFDVAFTNGVLIHVPPNRLGDAMREITRVARRFVLCSEYFSHDPVEIPYHGQMGLLWKRDFGRTYLETCAELRLKAYGFLWQHELPHFDNLNWWLFEKVAY